MPKFFDTQSNAAAVASFAVLLSHCATKRSFNHNVSQAGAGAGGAGAAMSGQPGAGGNHHSGGAAGRAVDVSMGGEAGEPDVRGGGTGNGGSAVQGAGGSSPQAGAEDVNAAGKGGTESASAGGPGSRGGEAGRTAMGGFGGAQGGRAGGTSSGIGGVPAGAGGIGGQSPYPVQLAIGALRICALISDGRVYCWGQGPLGNGGQDGSAMPVEVTGITDAIQITVGGGTMCALLADHSIRCWGDDSDGQISANGSSSDGVLTPVAIGGLTGVNEVLTTQTMSCALLSNGVARCWGSDAGGTPTATTTVPPLGVATYLGGGATVGTVCGVLSDQTVKCWDGVGSSPAAQSGLPANITQVTDHCALSSDGSVRCWGPGGQGQIGNGLAIDQQTPQQVQRLEEATWIGAGVDHDSSRITRFRAGARTALST